MHDALRTPQARRALAHRDIGAVYRALRDADRDPVQQRGIAALTGQSQSEVSEILAGRTVMGYDVLVRIADGLDIPRGWMGLAYDTGTGQNSAELHGVLPTQDRGGSSEEREVTEEVKRRVLLAAGMVVLGAPVLGKVLELPVRPDVPTPLPSRLSASDVTVIRRVTESLRSTARVYGGGADVVSAVAQRSLRLMEVSSDDQTKADLGAAISEMHTIAGWCCVDSGYHDNARAHFTTAMDLSGQASDGCGFAEAFWHAGWQMIDDAAWNDALKAFQLGLIKMGEVPDSDGASEAKAWLTASSALPLAAMGHRDAATRAISAAREWRPTTVFDAADMDYVTSCVYRKLGNVDLAEHLAESSVRHWNNEGISRRDRARADIALATIHVMAGEPDSATLASRAIESVAGLRSVRIRSNLAELVTALDARGDSTSRDLATMARRVA